MNSRNKLTGFFFLAVLCLFSCQEVPPFIDFSEPILLLKDTTYVTKDIPSNAIKNVLIEDISGVKCNNCPKAAEIAHNIQSKNEKGRVVVMTLHSKNFGIFTDPFADSQDTFNTDEATLIIDNLMGDITGLPAGAIDRRVFEGETILEPSAGLGHIAEEIRTKYPSNSLSVIEFNYSLFNLHDLV